MRNEKNLMKQISFVIVLMLAGCADLPFLGHKQTTIGGVYKENLDTDRLVDLVIVKKLTGEKSLGIFPKYTSYLEGYIRGVIYDYDDNPIDGIVVRVADHGKDLPGFDPSVTDSNGIYRIRFSLPIKKNKVDQRGTISYNPPWQQQLDILGAAQEPQTKETKFRLYYDRSYGIIGIGEDVPKTIVRKVTGAGKESKAEEKKSSARPVEKKPSSTPPAGSGQKKGDDFFGSFGDFNK